MLFVFALFYFFILSDGSRTEQETDTTVCLGSACADGRSFEGFNSGTGSSFIYRPDGCGSHAGRCSEFCCTAPEMCGSDPGLAASVQVRPPWRARLQPKLGFGLEFVQLTSFPE